MDITSWKWKKPNLAGAKYMWECYARKHLQLKRQQAQYWKEINEAYDQMQDETTRLLHAWIPKEAVVHLDYTDNWNKQNKNWVLGEGLNLCNFMDVVQSKGKNLANCKNIITDQQAKICTSSCSVSWPNNCLARWNPRIVSHFVKLRPLTQPCYWWMLKMQVWGWGRWTATVFGPSPNPCWEVCCWPCHNDWRFNTSW